MNIVIVGAGEVGYHLAEILSHEEHGVAVVDADPQRSRRLMESLDVQVLVGDGTRADMLTQAGTTKADLLVAVTDSDRTNMLVCVLAKALGARRVILRLRDTSLLRGYRYFYKETLGFDVVLSTEELAAEEILSTVREHHALEVETFADGRVQLRRLRLKEESELTAEPIAGLRLPAGVLIVAVSRKDRFLLPDGNEQLRVGDQLYVIGKFLDLDAFERMAGERTVWRRSVVIMGAGGIGCEIARKLETSSAISIRLIERDSARAQTAASLGLSNSMVLEGDATDLELLLEERIGEANIFIATTDDDEQNMVACQLAKSLGVERTVALVNKASYRQIYDLLGIDQAISPRILCANSILRFVRSGSVSAISVIGEGRAEVLEMEVRLKDDKPVKVKDLGLPRGAVLGALLRSEQVLIPNGDTMIEPGDQAIVFSLPENLEKVEKLFKGD